MAEYVYKESVTGWDTTGSDRKPIARPTERRERVVRCRDCKYSRRDGWECWRFVDDPEEDFERIAIATPEGFCSWGERREGC